MRQNIFEMYAFDDILESMKESITEDLQGNRFDFEYWEAPAHYIENVNADIVPLIKDFPEETANILSTLEKYADLGFDERLELAKDPLSINDDVVLVITEDYYDAFCEAIKDHQASMAYNIEEFDASQLSAMYDCVEKYYDIQEEIEYLVSLKFDSISVTTSDFTNYVNYECDRNKNQLVFCESEDSLGLFRYPDDLFINTQSIKSINDPEYHNIKELLKCQIYLGNHLDCGMSNGEDIEFYEKTLQDVEEYLEQHLDKEEDQVLER